MRQQDKSWLSHIREEKCAKNKLIKIAVGMDFWQLKGDQRK